MNKNGRNSCTGNPCHVNLCYFFVKNRIENGEIRVEYCLTLLMIADYFTTLIMGTRFRDIRDVIMGYKSIFDIDEKWLLPIKECVENNR